MIHSLSETSKSKFIFEQDDDSLQPNAFDFRISRVFRFKTDLFELRKDDSKTHRTQEEILPDENGFWILTSGDYNVLTDIECKISEGEAGFVIQRSSLNRNGIFLTSGLYDSGFNNTLGCVMHVNGVFKVQRGSRIGQFILTKAETLKLYNGSYNR
jgi:deoxycytidine triphosphate deaminase